MWFHSPRTEHCKCRVVLAGTLQKESKTVVCITLAGVLPLWVLPLGSKQLVDAVAQSPTCVSC